MADGPVIRAKKNLSPAGGVDLGIATVAGQAAYQGHVTFEEQPAERTIGDSLTLEAKAAQQLLDDLWDAGVRPTRKPEPVAIIAAKDAHISQLFELAKLALSK